MAFNTPAAYGLYSPNVALREVTCTLNQAGFANEDICLLLSPDHPISTAVRDARILDPGQGTAHRDGMIGWLSSFGGVSIPSVGFLARSRAFFHAMMKGLVSPAPRSGSRTLAALGFPELEADRFEDQLQRRGALIYISCAEVARSNWAIQLLQRTGAEETATLEDKNAELTSRAAA